MAKGKFEKTPQKRTIKTYHKYEATSQSKSNQKKNVPKYKMKKRDKKRILIFLAALGAASWISSAVISPNSPPTMSANAVEVVSTITSNIDEKEPEILYTLGVGNYDSEITIENNKSYPIDDSFVIVSENTAVTSDVHGNFLKGQIDNNDYTKIIDLTAEEMDDFAFYQVVSESGANVIFDNNIVSTIPNGDYVLAYKSDSSEKYMKALCSNGGNLYQGNIEKNLLQEIGDIEAINYKADQNVNNIENIAMVNTKTAQYINLKLREQPGQSVISEIPHGSFVQVSGETMQYGNKTWAMVKYQTPSGEISQGWVASNYLSLEVVQEKPSPTVREGINVNATGNVTGIDISGMSAQDLNRLFESGISSQTPSIHGVYNTSELTGNIGFVGIKLGASSYAKGDLNILDYDNYKEQVALCEAKGVPYILYYYSSAITSDEALKEVDVAQTRIEDLKQQYGLKYCISIAVDKELASNAQNDRQYRGNIEEQTKALATFINEVQNRNLSDTVLIYSPGRVMQPDLDQIFDLESLRPMLNNPENTALWQCSLMHKSGNSKESLKRDIAYAESKEFHTAISQVVLDAKSDSGEKYDINNMDFSSYKFLTNNLDIAKNTPSVVTLDNKNNQNEQSGILLEAPSRYDEDLEI